MTCKNCIHFDVCQELRHGDISDCNSEDCGGFFKNKADFVSVTELIQWCGYKVKTAQKDWSICSSNNRLDGYERAMRAVASYLHSRKVGAE